VRLCSMRIGSMAANKDGVNLVRMGCWAWCGDSAMD
jgi:hypothetical protein